jgi:hypothetical protein
MPDPPVLRKRRIPYHYTEGDGSIHQLKTTNSISCKKKHNHQGNAHFVEMIPTHTQCSIVKCKYPGAISQSFHVGTYQS